jgi:3-hydroxy-D-aspartate aldolase
MTSKIRASFGVHDRHVGVRNGKVEVVWPVSARGKSY